MLRDYEFTIFEIIVALVLILLSVVFMLSISLIIGQSIQYKLGMQHEIVVDPEGDCFDIYGNQILGVKCEVTKPCNEHWFGILPRCDKLREEME